jgi:hypothetical protein
VNTHSELEAVNAQRLILKGAISELPEGVKAKVDDAMVKVKAIVAEVPDELGYIVIALISAEAQIEILGGKL